MGNIELYISGDNAVLDIEPNYLLEGNSIIIHNNPFNPASIVYFNLPGLDEPDAQLEVYSSIKASYSEDERLLNLILLIQNDTYIHNGILRDFNQVS
jgi:hypothetical protein